MHDDILLSGRNREDENSHNLTFSWNEFLRRWGFVAWGEV